MREAGALAFARLMASEFALALALGQTPRDYVATLSRGAGALGPAGQVAFGLMPWVRD